MGTLHIVYPFFYPKTAPLRRLVKILIFTKFTDYFLKMYRKLDYLKKNKGVFHE